MKKRLLVTLLSSILLLTLLAGCGGEKPITIAIPNDTTNEARALLLLENNGLIKLKEDAGITATIKDIEVNEKNIEFKEVEAAQIPNILKDVDFAVINSNYAIQAGLSPTKDSLLIEGSDSDYSNLIGVKAGKIDEDLTRALKAACESKEVLDFIGDKFKGEIVGVVENPTDGYDPDIDYEKLRGEKITIAASPTPHREILEVCKDILSKKDITLDIIEFTDYIQPNLVVNDGEVDFNFFQHKPYLDDFNEKNNTEIVPVTFVHVEPMGLYGGKEDSLDLIK